MKMVWLAVGIVVTATLAHAEDMAEMISQYPHEDGLSLVKADLQLTAIAETAGKGDGRLGHHGSQRGRWFIRLPSIRRTSRQLKTSRPQPIPTKMEGSPTSEPNSRS